jgi:hypothetical protein
MRGVQRDDGLRVLGSGGDDATGTKQRVASLPAVRRGARLFASLASLIRLSQRCGHSLQPATRVRPPSVSELRSAMCLMPRLLRTRQQTVV